MKRLPHSCSQLFCSRPPPMPMAPTRDPTADRRSMRATITSRWSPRTRRSPSICNDDKDKPVDAKGFKATGIFVVGGKPQRIELKPESANKLTGTSSVPLPATLKGAVQITLPDGQDRAGQVRVMLRPTPTKGRS